MSHQPGPIDAPHDGSGALPTPPSEPPSRDHTWVTDSLPGVVATPAPEHDSATEDALDDGPDSDGQPTTTEPREGDGSPVASYLRRVSQIASPIARVPADEQASIRTLVGMLERLPAVTRDTLATVVRTTPDAVPHLAAIVGLSQTRLKQQLRAHLGSESWLTRAQRDPYELVDLLDDQFDLVAEVHAALHRPYTLADVVIARSARKASATAGIDAGRHLEDQVEAIVRALSLPFDPRTQFVGVDGEQGPADFAIPAGGSDCLIAIGVKGFDSTGSKLTAAVDEVRRMVAVRRPDQYMLAVVDGIGWHGRQGDLGRLVAMRDRAALNGLYTVQDLGELAVDLRDAAVRLGLLDP